MKTKDEKPPPNWSANTFVVFGARSELALLRDYLVKHTEDNKQKADDAVKYAREGRV